MRSSNLPKKNGQAMMVVVAVLGIVLFTTISMLSGASIYKSSSEYSIQSEQATAIAEAGIDKALASLNKTGGSYNGESDSSLGDGKYDVTVTNKDASTKVIKATGYFPDKTNPKSRKTIQLEVSKGLGIAFTYGMQLGEGGLVMGNSAVFNGTIFSGGNIMAGNTNTINGDVYIAGGAQAAVDQSSDCAGLNCADYIFGKTVSGENRQDVAQSFKPSVTGILTKISLKLKKTGNPANPTVRIMRDSGGKPDKNGVLASTTLSAGLVSTGAYGFIDVTYTSPANLTKDTTYWIMIHANSLDNSNYWYWSNDTSLGYTRGQPKWSANWSAHSPVWTTISGDLGFKTYTGGTITSINMGNNSVVTGNVYANTINGTFTINKNAYYQTIAGGVNVFGTKYPGSADQPQVASPISDANITDWQNEAEAGGVTVGNISGCSMTLGPKKIVGNLTLGNSCTVTVKSPLWITGNITTGNSTIFELDSSFGSSSGVIIINGTTVFGNSGDLVGSGTAGSYLMLLSTYDSRSSGTPAFDAGNSAFSGIFYTPYGKIKLGNGASFKEITAWQIELGNGSILNYESGLASTNFSAGPSGSYSIIKGTYQLK